MCLCYVFPLRIHNASLKMNYFVVEDEDFKSDCGVSRHFSSENISVDY